MKRAKRRARPLPDFKAVIAANEAVIAANNAAVVAIEQLRDNLALMPRGPYILPSKDG